MKITNSTGQRPVIPSAITTQALKGRKPGFIAASVLNTISRIHRISGFTGLCRCYCNPAILLILLIVFKTWRNNPLKGTSAPVTAHPGRDGSSVENPSASPLASRTGCNLNGRRLFLPNSRSSRNDGAAEAVQPCCTDVACNVSAGGRGDRTVTYTGDAPAYGQHRDDCKGRLCAARFSLIIHKS
jgi:hypothetical protein